MGIPKVLNNFWQGSEHLIESLRAFEGFCEIFHNLHDCIYEEKGLQYFVKYSTCTCVKDSKVWQHV